MLKSLFLMIAWSIISCGIFLLIPVNQFCLADDQDFMEDLLEEYEEDIEKSPEIFDPFYNLNYVMYRVNDVLYFYALKPVAKAYNSMMPQPVRKGISSFFHNLMFPVRFVNNSLQGKMKQAGEELGVFLVNSTLGFLGFFQVAQNNFSMNTQEEDLGQTFGRWGIGNGFYLVLPFIGPSSLRDIFGRAGDFFITPINYVDPWEARWTGVCLDKINSTGFRIGDYEALKSAAIDPYTAIKNAYVQNRTACLKD